MPPYDLFAVIINGATWLIQFRAPGPVTASVCQWQRCSQQTGDASRLVPRMSSQGHLWHVRGLNKAPQAPPEPLLPHGTLSPD
jgi:hypothetical protein